MEDPSLLANHPSSPHDLSTFGAISGGEPSEFDMAKADFDLDGDMDVVIVRKSLSTLTPRSHALLLNQGNGFLDVTAVRAPELLSCPSSARDVATGDVNGDSLPDFAIGNTYGGDPQLYLNQGFTSAGVWLGLRKQATWFTTEQNNTSFLLDNTGTLTPGVSTCAIVLADLDADGDLDCVLGNYLDAGRSPRTRMLLNDGGGAFVEATSARLTYSQNTSPTPFTTGMTADDLNGDGHIDLLLSDPFSGPYVAINQGGGMFSTIASAPGGGSH